MAKTRGDDDDGTGGGGFTFPPDLLESMTSAMTAAFAKAAETAATAAAAAVASAAAAPAVPAKMSTAITPYDTEWLDLESKEGKSHWRMVTGREEGWTPLALTTENADAFADLVKDRVAQYGLDPLTRVPTSGNGAVAANPKTIAGVDHFNADLGDLVDILREPHNVPVDDVRKFSGWIFGGEGSTLTIPDENDMVVRAIDPNKPGNLGLVNRRKILMRQYSGILDMIFKNHLKRTSYNLLNLRSNLFTYTNEVTRRQVSCGLIKLKMIFETVSP